MYLYAYLNKKKNAKFKFKIRLFERVINGTQIVGPPGATGQSGVPGETGQPGAPGSCDHCPPARLAPGY